jgi:hypothetical protein
MRRKKVALQVRGNCAVFNEGVLRISKEENVYYFEIGNEITCDVAEAVAIMMRKVDWGSSVWDLNLEFTNLDNISPERTLFWLSGGYTEWRNLDNYNRPWCDCYLDFQEEFGGLVYNIAKRTKSLREIRENFIKYLNLPTLYEFALSKDFVR